MFKNRKGLCSHNCNTVDNKGGCAGHTKLAGSLGVYLNLFGVLARIKALIESLAVKSKFSSQLLQVLFVESTLVFSSLAVEDQVVILPKSVLVGCTLAGLGCPCRFGTQECKVIVSKPDLIVLNINFFNLTPRVSGIFATKWSLKIAEFDDGDLGVRISFKVARLGDHELHHLLPAGLVRLIPCG